MGEFSKSLVRSWVALAILVFSNISFAYLDLQDMDRVYQMARDLQRYSAVRELLRDALPYELLELTLQQQEMLKVDDALSDISETQLVVILRENKKLWSHVDQFLATLPPIDPAHLDEDIKLTGEAEVLGKKLADEVRNLDLNKDVKTRELMRLLNNVVDPLVVNLNPDEPAFHADQVEYYNSHPGETEDGEIIPADNLHAVKIDFIQRSGILVDGQWVGNGYANYYEIDSVEKAQAIVERARMGIPWFVGVDKNKLHTIHSEEVARILEAEPNVMFTPVDSVKLNHQKLMAVNVGYEGYGQVLNATANATISGSHPEGDFHERRITNSQGEVVTHIPEALPNVNEIQIIKSDEIALLVRHELTKTIIYKYKGTRGDNSYPLNGVYRFLGDVDEDGFQNMIDIAFSPRGAIANINHNILGAAMANAEGDVYLASFAPSSEDFGLGLKKYINKQLEQGKTPRLKWALDPTSSIAHWNLALDFSGLVLAHARGWDEATQGPRLFKEIENDSLREALGEELFDELTQGIMAGKKSVFGFVTPKDENDDYYYDEEGNVFRIEVKIHLKSAAADNLAIVGSSFNQSDAAEYNQEQIFVSYIRRIAQRQKAAIRYQLRHNMAQSVREAAIQKNVDYWNEYKKDYACPAIFINPTDIAPFPKGFVR